MKRTSQFAIVASISMFLIPLSNDSRAEEKSGSQDLIQYGSMHETIGKKNHQARVGVADLLKKPHFYAVGAVEGLRGEITIFDSEAIVTGAREGSKPEAKSSSGIRATLLVGRSVSSWNEVIFEQDVPHGQIDDTIGKMAAAKTIDATKPFLFVIEGEFTNVRLHVINGACPIHARIIKKRIADDQKPFEFESERVKGTVVGVFASGSVGDLTHPATAQHSHLIYIDQTSGERVTGHLEQFGVMKGTVLKLAKTSQPSED